MTLNYFQDEKEKIDQDQVLATISVEPVETFTARNLASGGSHPPSDNHGRAESRYKYYFLRTGALLFIMVYYIPSAAAAAATFFRFSD